MISVCASVVTSLDPIYAQHVSSFFFNEIITRSLSVHLFFVSSHIKILIWYCVPEIVLQWLIQAPSLPLPNIFPML